MTTLPIRIVPWDRGSPAFVFLRRQNFTDHRRVVRPAVDMTALQVSVCEPTVSGPALVEPPVLLTGRSAITMSYDATLDEWRAAIPYGVDLHEREQVRLVVIGTVAGIDYPVRFLDALAVFQAAQGL